MHRASLLLIVLPVAIVGACDAFSGNGGRSATDADGGAPTAADVDGSSGPVPDAAVPANIDGGVMCTPVTPPAVAVAEADVAIQTGATGNIGDQPIANMNSTFGITLVRFPLTPQAVSALQTGRVVSASITLTRAISNPGCGPNDGGCLSATFDTVGMMVAAPMRSDWVETKATWATTDGKMAWGDAGASGSVDRGAVVGNAAYAAADPSTTMVLGAIDTKWISANQLSFVIWLTTGNYVYTTHEAVNDTKTYPRTPEILTISYCP